MQGETVRHAGEYGSDMLEILAADAGRHWGMGIGRLDDGGGSAEAGPVPRRAEFQHAVVTGLQLVPDRLLDGFRFVGIEDVGGDQLLFVNLPDGFASGDQA